MKLCSLKDKLLHTGLNRPQCHWAACFQTDGWVLLFARTVQEFLMAGCWLLLKDPTNRQVLGNAFSANPASTKLAQGMMQKLQDTVEVADVNEAVSKGRTCLNSVDHMLALGGSGPLPMPWACSHARRLRQQSDTATERKKHDMQGAASRAITMSRLNAPPPCSCCRLKRS